MSGTVHGYRSPQDPLSGRIHLGLHAQPARPGDAPASAVPLRPAERERVDALRAEAERTGDARLDRLADQLERSYRGREMARLSEDVYAPGGIGSSAPEGWTRASASPEVLGRYGLTPEMLAPAGTGFRAELYVPDPAVFGPDANAVLAFKGTEFTSMEDWANNFLQGTGNEAAYYSQAMDLARTVRDATGGRVEFTGHSLGGGLASAAAGVSGQRAWTFNAAGLHPETVPNHVGPGGMVYDANRLTVAFQVDGDILTEFQQAAPGLSPGGADRLAQLVRFGLRSGDNALVQRALQGVLTPEDLARFEPLLAADGEALRSMPSAAGETVALPARERDGSLSPELNNRLGGEDGLLPRLERAVSTVVAPIATGHAIGSLPGEALVSGSQWAGDRLIGLGQDFNQGMTTVTGQAGDLLTRRGAEWSATVRDATMGQATTLRQGGAGLNLSLTQAGQSANRQLTGAGDGANQVLTRAGEGVRDATGNRADAIEAGSRNAAESARRIPLIGGLVGGAVEFGGRLGSGAVRLGGDLVGGAGNWLGNGVSFTLDQAGNIIGGSADLTGNTLQLGGRAAAGVVQGGGWLAAGAAEGGGRVAGRVVHGAGQATGAVGEFGLRVGGQGVALVGDAIGTPLRHVGGAAGVAAGAPLSVGGLGVVLATDPVLRDVSGWTADLNQMTHRHDMSVVEGGLNAHIGEFERQADVLMGR